MTKLLPSTAGQVAALQREVKQLKKEKEALIAQTRSLKRLKGLPGGSNPESMTSMASSPYPHPVSLLPLSFVLMVCQSSLPLPSSLPSMRPLLLLHQDLSSRPKSRDIRCRPSPPKPGVTTSDWGQPMTRGIPKACGRPVSSTANSTDTALATLSASTTHGYQGPGVYALYRERGEAKHGVVGVGVPLGCEAESPRCQTQTG